MAHICVSKLAIIDSDNGLSPDRRQVIIRINVGIVLIEPFGNKFNWNLNQNLYIFIQENAFENIVSKIAAILSRCQSGKAHPLKTGSCHDANFVGVASYDKVGIMPTLGFQCFMKFADGWTVIAFQWLPWWRHQMETFSALLAIYVGNSPVPGELPTKRPVTRSFDIFFDLRLNKRLSKQTWGWWFETLSCPLWRHRNDIVCSSRFLSFIHPYSSG